MSTRNKIVLIEFILIAGFTASLLFHYQIWVHTSAGFPFSTILYMPKEQFTDFVREVVQSSKPYKTGTDDCIYPPFIEAVVNVVFVRLMHGDLDQGLVLFLTMCIIGHLAVMRRYVHSDTWSETWRRVITFSFCCYPFLFALDRANFEFWQYFLLVFFVWAIQKEKWNVANILLAASMNFKPFLALLIPIYVARKRWADLGKVCAMSVLLFLCGTLYYGPNILGTLHDYRCTVGPCTTAMLYTSHGVEYGCSLFGVCKILGSFMFRPFTVESIHWLATVYMPAAAIVVIVLAAYTTLVERELWKQLLIATAMMCILPPFAYDYRMYYLLLPMMMFMTRDRQGAYDRAYCILFGLLMVPKGYFHFSPPEISDTALINPMIMVLLIALVVKEGFMERRQGAPERDSACACISTP